MVCVFEVFPIPSNGVTLHFSIHKINNKEKESSLSGTFSTKVVGLWNVIYFT